MNRRSRVRSRCSSANIGPPLHLQQRALTGASYRLGIAPRVGAATLKLPPFVQIPGYLTFVVVPLGDAEPQVVGPIDVDVGTRLLFTVEGILSTSSLVKQR